MKKAPKMISTKDLSYISDMFNWNNTMIHKLNHYIEEETDEALLSLLDGTLDIIESNVQKLTKLLESGDSNGK